MKRVIVCDSGLGGLNIASRFFSKESKAGGNTELLYFNVYPSATCGFNKLPSIRAQEEVFRNVLEGMKKYSPDLCLIACNTLSIVYNRLSKWYTPPFPVQGLVETAVDGMFQALEKEQESSLLILGTKSTVESKVYENALIDRGIAPERIKGLACPGLATLLESDPAAEEVRVRISGYAAEADKLFSSKQKKLFLGLCCTHFGFASGIWKSEFAKVSGSGVELVNPNELLGTGLGANNFKYLSKIDFFPGARESMCAYFEQISPQIAAGLKTARPEKNLFEFNEEDYCG